MQLGKKRKSVGIGEYIEKVWRRIGVIEAVLGVRGPSGIAANEAELPRLTLILSNGREFCANKVLFDYLNRNSSKIP